MELTTTVVHCKKAPYDVYIGRPSKWGNPFVLKNEEMRESVLAQYREYLMSRPDLIAAAQTELKGKVLGCWCAPRMCHGDVLAEVAHWPSPEEEAKNAKTVLGMMSGRLSSWDVILKLPFIDGSGFARIFLGILPDMPPAEAAKEAKRQWPRQYKTGLVLRHRPKYRPSSPA